MRCPSQDMNFIDVFYARPKVKKKRNTFFCSKHVIHMTNQLFLEADLNSPYCPAQIWCNHWCVKQTVCPHCISLSEVCLVIYIIFLRPLPLQWYHGFLTWESAPPTANLDEPSQIVNFFRINFESVIHLDGNTATMNQFVVHCHELRFSQSTIKRMANNGCLIH